jgi:ABC-type phosphate transport system substrate-binding protein
MLSKKTAALAAVAGATIAALCVSIAPASAFDPVSNGYAIVGSDTLEDAVGALANGSNATGSGVRVTAADSSTLGNYDATGSGTIITKPYGVRFQRPNGSGDGRLAIERQIAGAAYTSSYAGRDTNYDGVTLSGTPIDITRGSSGGTAGTTVINGVTVGLTRYTFGRDAIAFAYGTAVTPGANGYISKTDMALIYQCDAATLSAYGITTAVIPQGGSGTRNDFLSKLGLTDNLPTSGTGTGSLSCITVGQEHDASNLGAHAVMPMSASRWIAMQNGLSYKRIGAGVQLGSLVSGTASVSVSGGVYKPVVAYYKDTTWGRDTYLFVDSHRVDSTDPAYDSVLAALFSYNDSTSLTYQGGASFDYASMNDSDHYPSFPAYTSAAVKLKFGFLPASTQNTTIVR